MTDTLGDALPREMTRVRDEVLPAYLAIPEGAIAAMMMRASLDAAQRALAEADTVAMIQCLKDLREYDL